MAYGFYQIHRNFNEDVVKLFHVLSYLYRTSNFCNLYLYDYNAHNWIMDSLFAIFKIYVLYFSLY